MNDSPDYMNSGNESEINLIGEGTLENPIILPRDFFLSISDVSPNIPNLQTFNQQLKKINQNKIYLKVIGISGVDYIFTISINYINGDINYSVSFYCSELNSSFNVHIPDRILKISVGIVIELSKNLQLINEI